MWLDLGDERRAFLSAVPAEARERRLALWVVGASTLLFLAAVPFAKTQLAPLPAFIASYQSALVVADLITAVLLYAQFSFLGARPLLALAGGYLFTAFMGVAHALTFPGLFAPAGLFGAGPQSTAWMYMFWHAGFPALVIVYALLRSGAREEAQRVPKARLATAWSVAAVTGAVCALTFLATVGQDYLPPIMQGNRYTPAMLFVVSSVWALSAIALLVVWRRPPHTVLELWLMVVLCAWLFDIGLAAVFNGGRYDLGFYAGRIYGLLAACFVLIVLLVENGKLYSRLLNAYAGEQRERRLVQEKTAELTAANKELDAFTHSVSHDLRAPLRAMEGYAVMLEEHSGAHLDEEGRRLLGVVRARVKSMGRLIEDLLEFSRLGRQELVRRPVRMAQLAREVAVDSAIAEPRARVRVAELPDALADQALIKQVWSNLIGNAFKYSGKRPEPQVEIGARREGSDNIYWVRDNGAGFDMRYAERLFGVFQRLHRAEEFPGTGVGLAIVQRVVARHGGRVWAEGQPDAGATFYFSLPAKGSAG
ncbi:MAG: sensor histidine kinase [Burkholderiales bacterium]